MDTRVTLHDGKLYVDRYNMHGKQVNLPPLFTEYRRLKIYVMNNVYYTRLFTEVRVINFSHAKIHYAHNCTSLSFEVS